ncbi:aspartate aminotransferase, mitochondrial-like [Neodiprion fabricii]|uniref:aspartate aminotransferase, mitochondrial-like n=1 Tax=Neodiprion fabricii TaxID=2872261 RepID=UPI001ED90835|nr:aspartate aminotransferase, mitochondrial-like [Neodiprion fabricii]
MVFLSSESWWSHVSAAPPDVMLQSGEAYTRDRHPEKVDLTAGVYRDDSGNPWVLPCVRQAEKKLAAKNLDKEYLPIDGFPDFCLNSTKLVLGEDSELLAEGRVAMIQAVGGTGGLRVTLEFMSQFYRGVNEIWSSDPTYGAYEGVLQHFKSVKKYRYYDYHKKCLDFPGFLEDIGRMPEGSIILFQPSAHNPSGVDPTLEQWAEISGALKKRRIYPIIDVAHLGLAKGDTEQDSASVRLFARDGHQFTIVQTYSKSLGLYGERVGSLSFVTASADEAARVRSQLKIIMREMYSCPPVNGVRIANEIFADPDLKKQWIKDLKTMTDRINSSRKALKEHLDKTGTKLNWDHVTNQVGMCCFSGLTLEQVKRLGNEHHVYVSVDGRIAVARITPGNVERVARALHEVTK